ncbi:uncharacterized protein LAJ45_07658 [Morchella importuna]|uniref:uncharacterized protein n=1 Tax=Morchella importuna TaxID=1174673 RepID=UPI001E8CDC00|nr:uncharacterized protein LAJ45_07658 [Morchella importuna]KAH8148206.1 hypothetical protein LAJ45_07658 [Morchella importuna]
MMLTVTGVKVVAGLCLWSFFVAGVATTTGPKAKRKAKGQQLFVKTRTLSDRPAGRIVFAAARSGTTGAKEKESVRNRGRR